MWQFFQFHYQDNMYFDKCLPFFSIKWCFFLCQSLLSNSAKQCCLYFHYIRTLKFKFAYVLNFVRFTDIFSSLFSCCDYSKASRYTASSCTDLDNARFWIGSKKIWEARFLTKKIWEARFLINCYLRCMFFYRLLLEMHEFLRCTFFLELH